MMPRRRRSDYVGAVAMRVNYGWFQLCDERAKRLIFSQITPCANDNSRDRDVSRLEPRDEWVIDFGIRLKHCGNMHSFAYLPRRNHRDHALQPAFSRRSEDVEHFRRLTHVMSG